MRKTTAYIVLIGLLFPVLALASDNGAPPSSATIHQTLEQLWSNRQFDKLDTYVSKLEGSWDDYIPVQLTLAIYSYKYGAQVEDAIGRLKALRDRLNADIAVSSPVFMELLDGRILRYEKAEQFYRESGISREDRMEQRNPLKKTEFIHSKHWVGVDEMLYFNAPEIFITPDGVKLALVKDDMSTEQSLEQADMKELHEIIGSDKNPMPIRKAAVRELVRKRAAQGGVKGLIAGFRAGEIVYTYQDTVDELVKAGPDAIPPLVEYMNSPQSFSQDQILAIWALVRIGIDDAEVIEALESVASSARNSRVAEYARKAIKHLKSLK